MRGELQWFSGGLLLGAVFFLAVALAKPIGVSTEFVVLDGIIWQFIDNTLVREDATAKSGYASDNAYLDSSGGKLAKQVANPFSYGIVFVISIAVGAFLSARSSGSQLSAQGRFAPYVWRSKYGHGRIKRYVAAFVGGMLVLLGARVAGGCTSGHMMSGMMQTALSGYLFAFAAFATAVPVSLLVYRRR